MLEALDMLRHRFHWADAVMVGFLEFQYSNFLNYKHIETLLLNTNLHKLCKLQIARADLLFRNS